MKFPNIDLLPFPNSVFYLTGISLITLVYASYAKTINKIPQSVSEGIITASSKINEVTKSISNGTREFLGQMNNPGSGSGTGPGPQEKMLNPLNNNAPTPLDNVNPFSGPIDVRPVEAPRPQQVAGSKKKKTKRNKKTKRVHSKH
uniref:Uncharacterized protein n=1 Tax=viral metagenome TaxID=1070528 RepID=A0A6C0B7F4_9ZZZZ